MKLFIPAVGYRIRLVQDWSFNLYHEHRNKTLFESKGLKLENRGWGAPSPVPALVTIDSGTVLEVDRVYVRTANKSAATNDDDYDSVTFKVVGAKGKVRFWAKLVDVNHIEYELPEDHAAGKEQARAKATQPKKLGPEGVRQAIDHGFWEHNRNESPSWMTAELRSTIAAMAREYEARQRPLDLDLLIHQKAAHESEERHRFNAGALQIPVGLAHAIKTYEDYVAHVPSYNRWVLNENFYKPWYLIQNVIMRSYAKGSRSYNRDEQGRLVRRFNWVSESESYRTEGMRADLSDMWIEAVTNETDTEVIEVRAGFTKQMSS